jgi:tetratricopeptide (TPR) repeat protein
VPLLGPSNARAQSTAPEAPAPLDDASFRQGLRQRGLDRWLQQYEADTPPADSIEAVLRQREQLLAEAGHAPTAAEHAAALSKAEAVLASLIAEHPADGRRLAWQLELAGDVLEREGQGPFDTLLLYDLPGRERRQAVELSRRGMETLDRLRSDLRAEWKRLESLDESAVEQSAARMQELERIDSQSAMLRAWAGLYAAFADADATRRRRAAAELFVEVAERRGWTEASAAPLQRCSALMLAGVAARLGGRFDEATACTREFLTALKALPRAEDRDRFRTASLLAVVEQIRTLRDSGKLDAAGEAFKAAQDWAARNRSDDLQAALAVALAGAGLEAQPPDVRTSSSAPASRPADGPWLTPAVAAALRPIAARSPAWRDGLYAALAGAIDGETAGDRGGFELQLIAGAAVSNAAGAAKAESSGAFARLERLLPVMQAAAVAAGAPDDVRGEVLFLIGKAHFILGQSEEAVAALGDLSKRYPNHDRASGASEAACSIAQSWWQGTKGESREARQAFIRAAQALRQRRPESLAAGAQYLVALALEQDGQLDAAADAYAAVPRDEPQRLRAVLGRARALENAVLREIASPTADATHVRASTAHALQVAREAADSAEIRAAAGPERCLAADIVLVLANLLNGPVVQQPGECLQVLTGFERRFSDCPAAIGPALRERIIALRQLSRLAEARQVVDQFLRADSASAGPVMANLLQAMRHEVDAAYDRGEAQAARDVAAEAAELARILLEWAAAQPSRLSALEQATVRTWQAWSVLESGDAEAALRTFDVLAALGIDVIPAGTALRIEIQLGRAECLLVLSKPAEALPLFSDAWQRAPERSQLWWRALVGSLTCHERLGSNREEIRQSIRQQRRLSPELGGPRWKRALEAIETGSAPPATSTSRP